MTDYLEPIKNRARHECLANAISLLTTERAQMPLARQTYVSDVWHYLRSKGTQQDQAHAGLLGQETMRRWEQFYRALLPPKSPAEIRVAYLTGPRPENDLEILMSMGVLPENVWAFEADGRTYEQAVVSTLKSRFPFLKLFGGTTAAFLQLAPVKFDLVYMDFCGPIIGRGDSQRNLHALVSLLHRHALTSPGVLITNCAFPSETQDQTGFSLLTKLIACYLYPKEFLEGNAGGGYMEGPIMHGLSCDAFLKAVRRAPSHYYSQFLTRLLMDIPSVIVPYQALAASNAIMRLFFQIKDEQDLARDLQTFYHFADGYDGGDVIVSSDEYPLLWTVAALYDKRNCGDDNYPDFIGTDRDFAALAGKFLRQLCPDQKETKLVEYLEKVLYLLAASRGIEKYYTQQLRSLSQRRWTSEVYQFCDLLLFHQVKELLVRQLAVPYHYNVRQAKRWVYRAREHEMYLDLSVLDECRYVYDWMPTLDLLGNGLDDLQRQLSFRFALDGISKHQRWYNTEFFSGTAVIDQYEKSFEAAELSARVRIE